MIDSKGYNREPAKNEILRNAARAGFVLVRLERVLPEDDIYLFRIDK